MLLFLSARSAYVIGPFFAWVAGRNFSISPSPRPAKSVQRIWPKPGVRHEREAHGERHS